MPTQEMMIEEIEMKNISTDSFRLATVLLASGHPVADTRREGRKTLFIFAGSEGLRDAIDEFQYGNPVLPVRDVFQAQSRLKSLIFDSPLAEATRC